MRYDFLAMVLGELKKSIVGLVFDQRGGSGLCWALFRLDLDVLESTLSTPPATKRVYQVSVLPLEHVGGHVRALCVPLNLAGQANAAVSQVNEK